MTLPGAPRPATSLDFRDHWRKPVCYLSPKWILRMRKRLGEYQETGKVGWFRPAGGPSADGTLNN